MEKKLNVTVVANKRTYKDKATQEERQFWAIDMILPSGIRVSIAPRENTARQLVAQLCEETF